MKRITLPIALTVLLALACMILAGMLLITNGDLSQCRARLIAAFDVQNQDVGELSELERDALTRWADRNSISISQALVGRRAITASKGVERCVLIALEPGAIGGSPMYCYDEQGNLTESFEQVE